jgi:hypothetical protein
MEGVHVQELLFILASLYKNNTLTGNATAQKTHMTSWETRFKSLLFRDFPQSFMANDGVSALITL